MRNAVPMDQGQLTFRRGVTWQDFVRSYTLIVDGEEIGKLRRGTSLSVAVNQGRHTCQARISWTGSKELDVLVPPGTEVKILISPPPKSRGVTKLDRAMSADEYLVLSVESDT